MFDWVLALIAVAGLVKLRAQPGVMRQTSSANAARRNDLAEGHGRKLPGDVGALWFQASGIVTNHEARGPVRVWTCKRKGLKLSNQDRVIQDRPRGLARTS